MADPYEVDASNSLSSTGRNLRGGSDMKKKTDKPLHDIVFTDDQVMVESTPKPGRENEYQEQKRKFEEQKEKRKNV